MKIAKCKSQGNRRRSETETALPPLSLSLSVSTSEIKISVVIDQKYTELAVRVLHDTFLGKQGNS